MYSHWKKRLKNSIANSKFITKPFFFLNAIEVEEMEKGTSKKEINDWVKKMQQEYPSEACSECHICLSKLFIITTSRNVYYRHLDDKFFLPLLTKTRIHCVFTFIFKFDNHSEV